MNTKYSSQFAIILLSIITIGCSEQIDNFTIKNISKKDIYVKKITGFNPSPPVGFLGSRSMAASMLMRAEQTGNCKIIWEYVVEEGNGMPATFVTSPCDKRKVDLKGREAVTIIFNSKEQWEIFETNNYRVDN